MPWKVKKVPATTNNITKAIINRILKDGGSASRINTQGQYDEKLGRWRRSGSRKGFFDIAACIKGKAVVIDVKKDDDDLGEDQIEFMQEWQAAGGYAFEARTYEDFDNWYLETFN